MPAMLDEGLRQRFDRAVTQINQIVVGKETVVRLSLVCLLARGHLLLEDLPGSGKTTLAKAFAATLGLDFRRIQFTADLLPADVLGFSMMQTHTQELRFYRGPVFTQLLLADEINRASPKSQSALLEAMEERQISIDHETHALDPLFFVIATQNPREQVGTFALPESQIDRFLMRLSLGYPEADSETAILRGQPRTAMLADRQAQLSAQDILALQEAAQTVFVSQAVAQYVQHLLAYTRQQSVFRHGLSTRAGLALIAAAQAYALIGGEQAVFPQHIQAVFFGVAWHRLHGHEHDNMQHQEHLQRVLDEVAVPL
ncbi:AAA family ATPase [Suttonella sp. R2A3]|uniref:AAA family ATPase n=1 Tax=Suttonella sp. R2A3 TaxID=2908648 RepID=UPI001F443547|nr:AAA family ATPase [Suttonella sp. R2A3]UJF24654.1 AAA family ATPase [Suttonella sp. R2A3]